MLQGKDYVFCEDEKMQQVNPDIFADHHASPSEVMESVNRALKQHGLQVLQHKTDSDEYAFSIVALI